MTDLPEARLDWSNSQATTTDTRRARQSLSPHDYAMRLWESPQGPILNQTLILYGGFSSNFLYGMQQLTKKLFHVSMSKIALGFRRPPTSLEERLTESCSVPFDAFFLLPKTRIHCKLKNLPRLLQVTFLKGKSGRMQASFKGRARSLELLTIWDF